MRSRKDEAEDGSEAIQGTELLQVQDPAGHRQGEAASLLEQSEPVPRGEIGEESQLGSAVGVTQKNTRREDLAPVKWIRSHPKITLGMLILLLLLVLVLSWVVVSGRSCAETPVTPVTPVTQVTPDAPITPVTTVLLPCPHEWIGYRGICYFLSRDQLSWDQAQARCSELGASLAVIQDWEMEFLFLLSWNTDRWLGLRRRGRELQWGDGSSFNSSVPVRGNSECVYLSENYLGSGICSNPLPFVCSRPQTPR